jgi:hypothetical protein
LKDFSLQASLVEKYPPPWEASLWHNKQGAERMSFGDFVFVTGKRT